MILSIITGAIIGAIIGAISSGAALAVAVLQGGWM